jgi:hypothetical protein
MIGTTDSKWTHEGEEPASEGRVYREVSFNEKAQRTLTAESGMITKEVTRRYGVLCSGRFKGGRKEFVRSCSPAAAA